MRIFADNILHDKVVLVTGGGTGIGRGIALGMAGYGAHLVLASRHIDHLRAVALCCCALRLFRKIQSDI